MLRKIKEPVSCLTHMAGAFAGLICTVFLIYKAIPHGASYIVPFAVFGASLVLLYLASALYHMLNVPEKVETILQKFDHAMIFSLIAGTYTPTCLIPLRGPWGWSILGVVWGIALLGVFMKIFWINAPRLLSTAIYLIMGWVGAVAFLPLVRALSTAAFVLLALGGAAYTMGAIIYAAEKPNFSLRHFGFHELFHLFVMAGSAFHVLFMFQLLPA